MCVPCVQVKTFGLQIVELIKPIVMKHIHSFQLGKRREALVNATTGAIASAGNMILPGHVAGHPPPSTDPPIPTAGLQLACSFLLDRPLPSDPLPEVIAALTKRAQNLSSGRLCRDG